jgi:hypothetical protein
MPKKPKQVELFKVSKRTLTIKIEDSLYQVSQRKVTDSESDSRF